MKADAWMPLDVGHYIRDTMNFTTVEHGAYLLLIMHYWVNGSLSSDPKELRSITKMTARQWSRSGPVLLKKFDLTGSNLFHSRIEYELEKKNAISRKRSKAGSKGAASKWQKPSICHPTCTSTYDQRCGESFVEYVQLFDRLRTEVFGDRHRRPWPNGLDGSGLRSAKAGSS